MPKPRLITIGPSHYCEKARWALDLAGIEYVEKAHAPVLHYAATLIRHRQRTVPILVTARATIGDSTAILHYADASMDPGRRLFPTEQPLLREVEELEELFDGKLGPSTRRVAYFHLLYDAERTRRVVGSGISPTERLAFRLARPAIVALMRRGLKINAEQANRSEQRISAVFDEVEARLSHGGRYLVANRLTAADLTFAALAAPVLLPPEYGWPLPPLEEASTEARALAERLRARPAGIFGMRLYRQERHGASLGHLDPLDRVRAAYDPELFRTRGHWLVDRLADYLRDATRGAMPVLPWKTPDDQLSTWSAKFPSLVEFDRLFERVLAESHHLHHPRYVGHQVTAPLPEAALADLVSSLLNNGTAIYEMGPVSTIMERHVIRFLANSVGFPEGADGVFTSGGSVGNLTALAAARQAKAGFDAWTLGAGGGAPLSYLVSSETHYSVARALAIMGLGKEGAEPVPVDPRFRMRPDALADAKRAAEGRGRKVVAVVASAGSTATGAFDPLAPIADFCHQHGLWFHVDAAHGASAVLSSHHKPRLSGLGRADSIVWDAHKMMLMPALVTAVLFRDGRRSYQAFAQEASYLFGGRSLEEEWFNGAHRTLECTKVMMCLKWYTALVLHGPDFFADYVDGIFALASRFAERIEALPDFELAVRPDCNIVCFRYLGPGITGSALDDLQERVRNVLVREGAFYLVEVRLFAGIFLRVTLINPFTRDEDLDALLAAIRAAGQRPTEIASTSSETTTGS